MAPIFNRGTRKIFAFRHWELQGGVPRAASLGALSAGSRLITSDPPRALPHVTAAMSPVHATSIIRRHRCCHAVPACLSSGSSGCHSVTGDSGHHQRVPSLLPRWCQRSQERFHAWPQGPPRLCSPPGGAVAAGAEASAEPAAASSPTEDQELGWHQACLGLGSSLKAARGQRLHPPGAC